MPNPLTIRPARARDADALARLCLEWEGAPARQSPELLLELWVQTLSDDDSSVYLALEGEDLLGFVHLTYQARPARLGWRATLEELHVVAQMTLLQMETATRMLLERVVEECRRRGDVIALYLLTQPDLEPHYGESLYNELGFVPRGRDVLIWQGDLQG